MMFVFWVFIIQRGAEHPTRTSESTRERKLKSTLEDECVAQNARTLGHRGTRVISKHSSTQSRDTKALKTLKHMDPQSTDAR